MRSKGIIALVMLTTFLTGCASIVGKDMFPISFQSNPDDAKVTVKDEKGMVMFAGRTPTMFPLAAGESYFHAKEYSVTFSKPGYGDQTFALKATIDGWYFGNILFGGLIGLLIVDPITGKMWKLPNTPVFANLAEMKTAQNSRSVKFIEISQVPKEMRSQLIALN